MATWYNGFAEGETKTSKRRPLKRDKGHTMVEFRTTRRGSAFGFTYVGVCQCGKRFSSRQSAARVGYAHDAHLRKEGVLK